MRNTFLFDLDGTVLPMDLEEFMKLYFYNIGLHFKDDFDPTLLAKYIMESTHHMVKIKDGTSNYDKFMTHFGELINDDMDYYITKFYDFYNMGFRNVKASTYQSKWMRKSIDLLKEKGYDVVLATNPLFPLHANHHRINWAGFEPEEFSYISSFEDNHYTKPHLEYYEEVLNNINRKPEECYMVGNDVVEDLVVGKLGVKTYLITDCMLNPNNVENTANHTGNYQDFYEFVKTLDSLK